MNPKIERMHILIRLPNWLGDMVMSVALVKEVQRQFPGAAISVIVKKGLHPLLDFFPPLHQQFIFSKEEYKGMKGLYLFGRMIRRQQRPDLFLCLPDSFSSALMGFATGAKQRIGYKKELRSLFLTHAFTKKNELHRVEQYLDLLSQFTGKRYATPDVTFDGAATSIQDTIVVNINSEAVSRRLPVKKAVSLLNTLRRATHQQLTLVGGPSDALFVHSVLEQCASKEGIVNVAGKTNLVQLAALMQQAKAVLSTDSGPAHIANALQVPGVVLFGAGNEKNTGPYNKKNTAIIRLGQLPCEPCVNNVCKIYGLPKCLEDLDEQLIVEKLLSLSR